MTLKHRLVIDKDNDNMANVIYISIHSKVVKPILRVPSTRTLKNA